MNYTFDPLPDATRWRNYLLHIPNANQKDKSNAERLARIRADCLTWLFGTKNRNGPFVADGDAGRTRPGA